jgi:hypothetical protein
MKPLLFDEEVVDWEADLYPTASMVMKNNRITKASPTWSRWERKPFPHWATVDAAVAAATTDFSTGLANTLSRYTRYDLWRVVRTDELLLFNGSAAAPYNAVARAFGGIPATALVAGDKLVRVGMCLPEGAVSSTPHYVLEDEKVFRAAEVSITTQATSRILGTAFNPEKNRRKAYIEAARMEVNGLIKRGYFLSASGNVQTATTEQTGFQGVQEHSQTWTYDFNGLLTKSDFKGFLSDGPGRYIKGPIGVACSGFILNIISSWLEDASFADVSKDNDTVGFDVKNLRLIAGRTAKLSYESWLDEDPTLQGRFYVYPLNKKQGSRWVDFVGPEWDGRLQLNKDIYKNDSPKYIKDEWYFFGGFDHGPEICYGVGKGITG